MPGEIKRSPVQRIALQAAVASLYAGMTVALAPISFGAVQLRIAEVLCLLPLYLPESVTGLTVGCLIANFLGVAMGISAPWDILLGTFATFMAACITARIKNRFVAPLPSIVINGVIIGCMNAMFYTVSDTWKVTIPLTVGSIMLEEGLVLYILGIPLSYLEERLVPYLTRYRAK